MPPRAFCALGKVTFPYMSVHLAEVTLVILVLCVGVSPSNAEQFSHWYGFYTETLLHIAGPKCYPNYTVSHFPEYVKYTSGGKLDPCKSMATCLLQNVDEYDKADMQSATIILGLMPTILSYVGPTVGEMALISSRRPVLAALLGLGAPAIFATRPFDFNNPRESLTEDVGTFAIRRQSPFRATLLAIAQYLLLSLAVTNCLLNSMQLGSSTILSWKCSWSYLQLGWNFMPLAPHLCAALSVKSSKVSHDTLSPCVFRLSWRDFINMCNGLGLKSIRLLIHTRPDLSSYKPRGDTSWNFLQLLSEMVPE